MHAFTHSGTLIQHRSIFTCFVHHSHRCWPTGRPAQWDRAPAAPDGAAAPAAKVSTLHNHSQLVCQVTVRSGCPKVVMVRKYEEAAVWEGSYCTLADTVHIEVWKLTVEVRIIRTNSCCFPCHVFKDHVLERWNVSLQQQVWIGHDSTTELATTMTDLFFSSRIGERLPCKICAIVWESILPGFRLYTCGTGNVAHIWSFRFWDLSSESQILCFCSAEMIRETMKVWTHHLSAN